MKNLAHLFDFAEALGYNVGKLTIDEAIELKIEITKLLFEATKTKK